jgi:(R,R)-butanediol dehydrogenase / meso-butanediol dehydrogenase / diacetyl reductase
MVEPLAVAHHVVARAGMRSGERVLIIGAGPIGAAVALFARADGSLTMTWAARFEALAGGGPEVVFECVGLPGMLHEAVTLAGLRGRIVVAGVVFEEDRLPPLTALGKEVSIAYSQGYTERDFAAVIDALAAGRIDAAPLHSATIRLDELPETFESLRSNSPHCKVLVDPSA